MPAIPYFILIPLTAAFVTPAIGKRAKAAGGIVSALATIALVCLSAVAVSAVAAHRVAVYRVGSWMPPAGISLVVDGLSAFLLFTMNLVAFLVAVYAAEYMKEYTDRWKFSTLFMLMVAGINGVLVAGDIFTLFIFMETAAIGGYCLVAFGTKAEELEAAFKYLVMGSVASIFILLGIAFLYGYTSTLNLADMANLLKAGSQTRVIQFVSVLFLMGFGLKAALSPFHAWLPYAHSSAPAPVSAMLSGVSIKILGIYALARILFNVFGMTAQISQILVLLAVLSMVVGGVLAFGQTDVKRLFAYSSISQIGYVALGLGVATPLSIFGALFHLFNHSIFKSLLFLNSGCMERITGTRDLDEMRGIVSRSPVTGYTGLVAALSICGVPPFCGFWSKLIIIVACIKDGQAGLALVAVIVSILTLGYYFNALTPVWFSGDGAPSERKRAARLPPAMALPMVAASLIAVIGLWLLVPGKPRDALNNAVSVLAGSRIVENGKGGLP